MENSTLNDFYENINCKKCKKNRNINVALDLFIVF